ncbi:MAG: LuxR C-terminal-related transcriptional regulator [Polyangiaceae bacterium]
MRQASSVGYRLLIDEQEMEVPPAAEILIGRASECELLLKSGLVSRQHARLRHTLAGLLIEDLGSRNGVLVNGTRIAAPTLVSHGDVIGIGLKAIQVVDDAVRDRPEHLSTLPPTAGFSVVGSMDLDPTDATVRVQLDNLSKRERDVLELIVRGLTQKEMAQRLFVSVKTVETYRSRLAEKLGCQTRAELVTYAIAAGILRESLR